MAEHNLNLGQEHTIAILEKAIEVATYHQQSKRLAMEEDIVDEDDNMLLLMRTMNDLEEALDELLDRVVAAHAFTKARRN